MSWQVLEGDCVEVLRTLDAASVQTCVTSPPYWGLRDYGTAAWEGGDAECDHLAYQAKRNVVANPGSGSGAGGRTSLRDGVPPRECKCGAKRIDSQLGLEPTPEQYVENLVAVFREVRRVLRDDGTVWLNLGDSYAGGKGQSGQGSPEYQTAREQAGVSFNRAHHQIAGPGATKPTDDRAALRRMGLKPKDLVGIPWRVAFALQADGWWLRSDIIWAKPNPMPESVTDRPTRSHEYIFLLTKSARYFYDADAIRKAHAYDWTKNAEAMRRLHQAGPVGWQDASPTTGADETRYSNGPNPAGRNKRSVWTVTTQPFPGAHFATFPPKLIEPCILAGSPPKCCGECGTPWERVTERTPSDPADCHDSAQDVDPERKRMGRPPRHSGNGVAMWAEKGPKVETLGWRPTCDHDDDSGRLVVLDPFAGAGTTGVVALRHGREFTGIELNPEYAEMARERIRAFEVNPNGYLEGDPEPVEGQLGLLE